MTLSVCNWIPIIILFNYSKRSINEDEDIAAFMEDETNNQVGRYVLKTNAALDRSFFLIYW